MSSRARSLIALVAALAVVGAISGGVARLRGDGDVAAPGTPQPPQSTSFASPTPAPPLPAAPPPPRAYDEEDIATWLHGAPLGGVGPRHDPRSIWAALDLPWEEVTLFDEMWEEAGAGDPPGDRWGRAFIGDERGSEAPAATIEVRVLLEDGRPAGDGSRVSLELVMLGAARAGRSGPRSGAIRTAGELRGGAIEVAISADALVPGPAILSGEAWLEPKGKGRLSPVEFTLAAGPSGPVTLTAEAGVDLEVLVLDHEGRPVPGARVSLNDAELEYAVPTDERGIVRIEGIPAANWDAEITVRHDATDTAASAAADLDGVSARRTVRLPAPPGRGEIELRIVDEAGAPLEVAGEGPINYLAAGAPESEIGTWPLADRPFAVRTVPAGRYTVWGGNAQGLRESGLYFEEVSVDVRPGERAVAALVGRRPGTLRIRVVAEGASGSIRVRVYGWPGADLQVQPGAAMDVPMTGWVNVQVAPPGEADGQDLRETDLHFAGTSDHLQIDPGEVVERTYTLHRHGGLAVRARRPDGSPFVEGIPHVSSLAAPPAFASDSLGGGLVDESDPEVPSAFLFRSVPEGPCLVRWLGGEARAVVRPGTLTIVDVVVAPTSWEEAGGEGEAGPPPRPGALTVRVVDEEGRPARTARVLVSAAGAGGAFHSEAALGGAAVFDLAPGAYDVSAYGGGRAEGTRARVEVPEAAVASVTVKRGPARPESPAEETTGVDRYADETSRLRILGDGIQSILVLRADEADHWNARLDPLALEGGGPVERHVAPGRWRILGFTSEDTRLQFARAAEVRDIGADETVEVRLRASYGTGSVLVRLEKTGDEICALTGPGIQWQPELSRGSGAETRQADHLPAGRYTLVSSRGRLLRSFDLAEGMAIDLGTVRLGP